MGPRPVRTTAEPPSLYPSTKYRGKCNRFPLQERDKKKKKRCSNPSELIKLLSRTGRLNDLDESLPISWDITASIGSISETMYDWQSFTKESLVASSCLCTCQSQSQSQRQLYCQLQQMHQTNRRTKSLSLTRGALKFKIKSVNGL